MDNYFGIIQSGANMDTNSFKSAIDSNKCALSYTPSSFSGGRSMAKKSSVKKPVKPTAKSPTKPPKSPKKAAKKK